MFFFFNDTATTEIYTLSLHDALPILERSDNARVRKFAPCANLTNLKGAIVSKKENITNSERTGKKDNVSDTVNFAPKGRSSAIRRCFLLLGAKDGIIARLWSKAT